MPSTILILLIVAGVGIVGSIALIILTAVLSAKPSVQDEDPEADEMEYENTEGAQDEEDFDPENVEEVIFAPFEAEKTVRSVEEQVADAYAEEAAEDAQHAAATAESVAQLLLEEEPTVQIAEAEGQRTNSAVVGDFMLSIGNAQDIGARIEQQDAFAITPLEEKAVVDTRGVMAVVCDGMGGMECGAEAANVGAVTFMRSYLENEEVNDDLLVGAVYAANDAVYRNHQGKDGVIAGTTLVAASVMPDGLRFVSVGDSHIYLYRNEKLYQLNRDHNYFSELLEQVKAGSMTLEEAQKHPERAHLTSYVGIRTLELVDYNIEPVELRQGDRVLLCSDGLFKTLSIREITDVMKASDEYTCQDALMEAVKAKQKRKQDNITIVVLYCDQIA